MTRDRWAEQCFGRLAALLADSPSEHGDEIPELYSELLEAAADDPPMLARARELGRRIAELEKAEILPRTFVRRGPSRHD